jgi:hypothetical protein
VLPWLTGYGAAGAQLEHKGAAGTAAKGVHWLHRQVQGAVKRSACFSEDVRGRTEYAR